ncbi:MAG: hypothetical protein H0U59_00035 [Gemmatimonadaceae bacterium]|nr:hypothetical protein [Gemmatimonadaceae bacterium]
MLLQLRRAALLVCQVQTALVLLFSEAPATAHTDTTSKEQKKLGTLGLAMHSASGDVLLVPEGVFTQSSGRADESNEMSMGALAAIDDVLARLREHLNGMGLDEDVALQRMAHLTAAFVESELQARAAGGKRPPPRAPSLAAAAAVGGGGSVSESDADDSDADAADDDPGSLPLLPLRTAAESVTSAQSDHATVQRKQLRLMAESLAALKARREADDWDGMTAAEQERATADAADDVELLLGFCWNHKRSNTEAAWASTEQKLLLTELGPIAELPGSFIGSTLHMAGKVFGRTKHGNYEFGSELTFPLWMAAKHPTGVVVSLLRQIGSRNDVNFENAAILLRMRGYYLEFLLQKPAPNKLDQKLIRALSTAELLVALQARALVWFAVFQPLRDATKSKAVGSSFGGMEMFAIQGQAALKAIADSGMLLMDTDYTAFTGSAALDKDVKAYRDRRSSLLHEAVAADIVVDEPAAPAAPAGAAAAAAAAAAVVAGPRLPPRLLIALIQGCAAAALQKFEKFAADQLPGGVFSQPDAQLKAKLDKMPATNDNAESIFGVYDRNLNQLQNASVLTVSGMVAWRMQQTSRWLAMLLLAAPLLAATVMNFARKNQKELVSRWREREEKQQEASQAEAAAKAATERAKLDARAAYWASLLEADLVAATAADFDAAWTKIKQQSKKDQRERLKEQIEYMRTLMCVPQAKLPLLSTGAGKRIKEVPLASLAASIAAVLADVDAGRIALRAAAKSAEELAASRHCVALGRGSLSASAAKQNEASRVRVAAAQPSKPTGRGGGGGSGSSSSSGSASSRGGGDDFDSDDENWERPTEPRQPSARLAAAAAAASFGAGAGAGSGSGFGSATGSAGAGSGSGSGGGTRPQQAAPAAAFFSSGRKRKGAAASEADVLNHHRRLNCDQLPVRLLLVAQQTAAASRGRGSARNAQPAVPQPFVAAGFKRQRLGSAGGGGSSSRSSSIAMDLQHDSSAQDSDGDVDMTTGGFGHGSSGKEAKRDLDEAEGDSLLLQCAGCHKWRKVQRTALTIASSIGKVSGAKRLHCQDFAGTACKQPCDWCRSKT